MKQPNAFEKEVTQQRAADGLENFMLYVSSPWRVIWVNFIAGVFKGLGTVVGATIVIALIIWVLSVFKQVPLIGGYVNKVETMVEGYLYETNYNDELERVADSLQRIEASLKASTTPPTNESF